jgi:hypothetical protein
MISSEIVLMLATRLASVIFGGNCSKGQLHLDSQLPIMGVIEDLPTYVAANGRQPLSRGLCSKGVVGAPGCLPDAPDATLHRKTGLMSTVRSLSKLCFLFLVSTPAAWTQSSSTPPTQPLDTGADSLTCSEIPREDALPGLCAPPTSSISEDESSNELSPVVIELSVPRGTPLRVALDRRVRIDHVGELVHGKVAETVFAFDQPVIPAGSDVSGRVTKIDPLSGKTRVLAYASGMLSPPHKYEVAFDSLTIPGGQPLAIQTTVSPGSAEVVHLATKAEQEKQKSAAARAVESEKQAAENKVRGAYSQISSPGRLHRVKQFLLAQLPYRRQYLEPGTRFNASLDAPLNFGTITRTSQQLAAIGNAPAPDSILHARLVAEISSASAKRGTPITALLTEPLYSSDHQLLLPADTRLVGEVVHAKPAHKLHHNGELRVIFERIETPEGTAQVMQGSLEGMQVDRAAGLKLDEEGGTRATDGKKRYLSTALVLSLAAASLHPEYENGSVNIADSAGKQAGAGYTGLKLTGVVMSIAVHSTPVSIAFGAYGASASIYKNFLSRGRDVILVKDTPLEIGFGNPHPLVAEIKK